MEIRYERDLSNAYMVLPAKDEETGYQSRMVLENRLRGFLPVQRRYREGQAEYYYRISAMTSLDEYLEHTPLHTAFLKQIIFDICRSVEVLGEYLLTEEYLFLSPETIFVRETETVMAAMGGECTLCIYPAEKQEVKESLRQLMKYLMGKTDCAEEACAALCYELYGLLQKDNFCLQEFMDVLERPIPSVPAEPEKKNWTKQLFASRRNSGIMRAVSH